MATCGSFTVGQQDGVPPDEPSGESPFKRASDWARDNPALAAAIGGTALLGAYNLSREDGGVARAVRRSRLVPRR